MSYKGVIQPAQNFGEKYMVASVWTYHKVKGRSKSQCWEHTMKVLLGLSHGLEIKSHQTTPWILHGDITRPYTKCGLYAGMISSML